MPYMQCAAYRTFRGALGGTFIVNSSSRAVALTPGANATAMLVMNRSAGDLVLRFGVDATIKVASPSDGGAMIVRAWQALLFAEDEPGSAGLVQAPYAALLIPGGGGVASFYYGSSGFVRLFPGADLSADPADVPGQPYFFQGAMQ